MPAESRGAASVTLDTIIWGAITGLINEEEEQIVVRAVTDALLAKGELARRQTGRDLERGYEMYPDRDWMASNFEHVLVIPLEAS